VPDDDAHRGNIHDRSVRTCTVKPRRAFGARMRHRGLPLGAADIPAALPQNMYRAFLSSLERRRSLN